MGEVLLYLVDGTRRVLPGGAAAGLHHVADVFSGSQKLGHVHCGLRPQRVSLGLVGPRHAVHPYLTNRHTYDKISFSWKQGSVPRKGKRENMNVPWLCLTSQMTELWRPVVWSASCADTRTLKTELCLCCATSPAEIKRKDEWVQFKNTFRDTNHTQQLKYRYRRYKWWFISDVHLLTHCSLHRDVLSTGFPTEPFGRSLSTLSTYNDTMC